VIVTTGRPEAQAVPFPLGWSSDPDGMYCMLALFQETMLGVTNLARHCHYCSQRLEVLPVSPRGLLGHPPQMSIIPHVLPGRGKLTNVENLVGYNERQSSNSFTNQPTLLVDRADVWWYLRLSQVTGQAPVLWCSWQSLLP
jgi:hypothetical protein